MSYPDWLPTIPANRFIDGEKDIPLDLIVAPLELRELIPGHAWLVLKPAADDGLWLRFAVLEFAQSNGDGSNVRASLVFHGEGPTGALRECRHTYWGEDGYVFYPDGAVITAAFAALSEFFDDMVAK